MKPDGIKRLADTCRIFKVRLGDGRQYLKTTREFNDKEDELCLILPSETAQMLIDVLNSETGSLPVAYGRDFL